MRVSQGTRIMLGFALGLAAGAAFSAADVAAAAPVKWAGLIGEMWLDALRMTIIPLVFALIVTGLSSALNTAAAGSAALRTLAVFALLLLAATVLTAVATSVLLSVFPIPADALAGLRSAMGAAAPSAVEVPSLDRWLGALIPDNPFAAAAEGTMVQIVLFAIAFALAISRIDLPARERLSGFFDAVAKAMLVIVHWALVAAPIGVFALAFVLGARSGLATASAFAHYLALMIGLCLMLLALAYVLAVIGGRVPLGRFARAALQPQAVAASTQSSLASLPAMVDAAQRQLSIQPRIVGVVLPMAVATFRITSPSINLAIAIYCAHIFGVDLDGASLAVGIGMALLMTLAGAGVPGQATFLTTIAPICLALGVPLEALPLLIAIEAIPDIFRTVTAVTADLAVTALLARSWPEGEEAQPTTAATD